MSLRRTSNLTSISTLANLLFLTASSPCLVWSNSLVWSSFNWQASIFCLTKAKKDLLASVYLCYKTPPFFKWSALALKCISEWKICSNRSFNSVIFFLLNTAACAHAPSARAPQAVQLKTSSLLKLKIVTSFISTFFLSCFCFVVGINSTTQPRVAASHQENINIHWWKCLLQVHRRKMIKWTTALLLNSRKYTALMMSPLARRNHSLAKTRGYLQTLTGKSWHLKSEGEYYALLCDSMYRTALCIHGYSVHCSLCIRDD